MDTLRAIAGRIRCDFATGQRDVPVGMVAQRNSCLRSGGR
jgi:hypothetical protein